MFLCQFVQGLWPVMFTLTSGHYNIASLNVTPVLREATFLPFAVTVWLQGILGREHCDSRVHTTISCLCISLFLPPTPYAKVWFEVFPQDCTLYIYGKTLDEFCSFHSDKPTGKIQIMNKNDLKMTVKNRWAGSRLPRELGLEREMLDFLKYSYHLYAM